MGRKQGEPHVQSTAEQQHHASAFIYLLEGFVHSCMYGACVNVPLEKNAHYTSFYLIRKLQKIFDLLNQLPCVLRVLGD